MKITLNEIHNDINYLSKLFDDRIEECHKVPGMQSQRHSFILYRKLLWEIKDNINNLNIKEDDTKVKE